MVAQLSTPLEDGSRGFRCGIDLNMEPDIRSRVRKPGFPVAPTSEGCPTRANPQVPLPSTTRPGTCTSGTMRASCLPAPSPNLGIKSAHTYLRKHSICMRVFRSHYAPIERYIDVRLDFYTKDFRQGQCPVCAQMRPL